VKIAVPGVSTPMTGTAVVEADPLPKFNAVDRAARQAILMRIYEWTKTLGAARTAARALVAQRDSIKSDLHGDAQADSLNARIARTAADIDRALLGVNAARGPIEAWSGMPSVDQRQALDNAVEDAGKAIGALNKFVNTEIPAAYQAVAKKAWPRKVNGVAPPLGASRAR
jgi:hypothetical protein